MADPREDQDPDRRPERYPSVRQDDAVERTGRTEPATGQERSFDPSVEAPTPRHTGDAPGQSKQDGHMGPQGDPAEGKR